VFRDILGAIVLTERRFRRSLGSEDAEERTNRMTTEGEPGMKIEDGWIEVLAPKSLNREAGTEGLSRDRRGEDKGTEEPERVAPAMMIGVGVFLIAAGTAMGAYAVQFETHFILRQLASAMQR
jgi:hypothetical protein